MDSAGGVTNSLETPMEANASSDEPPPRHPSDSEAQKPGNTEADVKCLTRDRTRVRIQSTAATSTSTSPRQTTQSSASRYWKSMGRRTAQSSFSGMTWTGELSMTRRSDSDDFAGTSNFLFRSVSRFVGVDYGRASQHAGKYEPKALPRVFVDPVAMKEKLRDNMAKPDYNVCDFYKTSGVAQRVARHWSFERLTALIIAINAIWIWIDTDYSGSGTLSEAPWPFQVAEHGFCAYFFLEWVFRFVAFKYKTDCLRDAWFVFDTMLVTSMVLETWIMTFIVLIMGGKSGQLFNPAVMRLLRLLRLSRMMRMARLLRHMPELLIMIKGMLAAARSVFFTLLLLVIILYVFGIGFTQLLMDTNSGTKYFNSVPASMHTLLLYGTLLDNVSLIVHSLGKESLLGPIFFYVFILLSALTVLNMLIGVLCEVVSAVAATERESASVAHVKWLLMDLMKDGGIDGDGDGFISKTEFCALLDNPVAARVLHSAGVDVFGLVDCADFIFQQLSKEDTKEDGDGGTVEDQDAGDPQLTFGKFLEVVLQLRGSNVASVKDIMDLRRYVNQQTKGIRDDVAKLSRLITSDVLKSIRREFRSEFRRTNAMTMYGSQDETNLDDGAATVSPYMSHSVSLDEAPANAGKRLADSDLLRSSSDPRLNIRKGVSFCDEVAGSELKSGSEELEVPSERFNAVGIWCPIESTPPLQDPFVTKSIHSNGPAERQDLLQNQSTATASPHSNGPIERMDVLHRPIAPTSSQCNGPRAEKVHIESEAQFHQHTAPFSVVSDSSQVECRAGDRLTSTSSQRCEKTEEALDCSSIFLSEDTAAPSKELPTSCLRL